MEPFRAIGAMVLLFCIVTAASLALDSLPKEKSMQCTRLYPKPGVVISRCEEINP